MKYIKIGSYIYEYYDCDLCKGYVDRDFHTDHQFGEWEINDNYHIRYCGCVEAREKGDHEFIKTQDPNDPSKTIALCTVCGFAKPTLDHEHAPDGIDLWDLIFTDWYHDIIRQNITNPNPSLDDYCYRYDYLCSICGEEYSSYYTHKFENGICRRNGCGVLDPDYQIIEEPQELDNSSSLFEENETNAMTLSRKMDIPGNNGYYY